MKTLPLVLPLSLLAFAACAAPEGQRAQESAAMVADASGGGEAGNGREAEQLERKLSIAKARLAVAELEAEADAARHAASARHTAGEVQLAEASLARFQEASRPQRLASGKLDLQGAKDRAQEAAEELEQIKIMYKDQDLDDMTAEFVVSRGERMAKRAAERLKIQEAQLNALETRELPQEQQRLALAVDKAVAQMEQQAREATIAQHRKAIAVQEAKNEVRRLEEELAELREDQP